MPFAIPHIWREPTNHHNVVISAWWIFHGMENQETERKFFYSNIPSSIPSVNDLDLPIPQWPLTQGRSNYDLSSTSSEEDHTKNSH